MISCLSKWIEVIISKLINVALSLKITQYICNLKGDSMKDFYVLINCKIDELNKIDNKIITTRNPIQELRKLFPNLSINRGNCLNWNVMLWNRDTDTHLYYVANYKSSI